MTHNLIHGDPVQAWAAQHFVVSRGPPLVVYYNNRSYCISLLFCIHYGSDA